MAKPARAGASGKKKPRHTAAQKKAARQAREKQARAQLKGGRGDRRGSSRGAQDERPGGKQRWRDRDERDPRGQGERAQRRRDGADDRGDRGGYRRDDRDGYRRDDRGGYRRNDRDDRGGYRRDDRGDRGGYRRDDRGDRGGYRRDDRDDRGDRGGYRRDDRDDRGGYRRERDDRGGYRRERDDRGGYRRDDRDDRGGYRRDDRGGSREGQGRQQGSGYQERTWRSHREEREGRPGRGRHEGRSWDEGRRREDRGPRGDRWEDRRGGERGRPSHSWERGSADDAFAEAEAERDAADAAYQDRVSAAHSEDVSAAVEADNGFAPLGLREELVTTLARIGITTPFPIQAATIPDAMAGRDLLGRGQTGSGKTMAFGLPLLDRLAARPRAVPHRPRAVILTPTRELAMQIVDALAPLMRAVDRRFVLVAGGMSYTPQLKALEKGVDVLVATPGRLIDLIERNAADLSEVEVTVLDEADHMAEMGFVEAIRQVLDLTPSGGQRLLFSATLDHGVDQVARTYLKDPVTHSTDDARASVTTMAHHVFLVHPHHKKPITAAIANRSGRTVVFCRTKLGADRVALQLRESGVFAAALHGGLNQAQRTRVLDAFKSGTLPVLVATDVAARGIHVDDVSLVLQVDPPADHKDYLHRSGRTARAGEDGVVVTLALPHQKRQVARMLDAAGVETEPRTVAPEDHAVIETAGGAVPDAEPVPQSRLDDVMRPKRGPGRGGPRGPRGPRQGGRRPQGRGGPGQGRGAGRQGDRRQDRRPRD
ncbi:ATP-dependent RNA helicase [Serinicoccus hydrothermalis]|uniref:ATP-dependent RNA helicase n=2 Tax=Serinicoccus hydrothermalis TaxID=1758689 RepID=A0A1B1N9X8_9MICO|nr:ATP-dependent RNA helicase [Serinicoccus hydrothermalis]